MTRHLNSAGEPAAAGPGGPDGLWAQIPGGLRSPRLSPDTVPEEYRSAFRHYGDGTRNSRGRTPIDLTVLPDGLRKEITWCMFRIADLGGVIGMSGAGTVVRMLGAAVAADNRLAASPQVSLLDADVQEWCQRIRAVFYRDSGRFLSPSTMRCAADQIQRYSRVLEAAYDTRDWWQREVWRPAEDPRIPQRDHEPRGRESIGFTRFTAPWLRAGLQWSGKSVLETGQMTWSTLLQRVGAMTEFDAFLAGRGSFPPYLADDPAAVRALIRDYLAHVSTRRVGRGKRAGEPISASQRKILVICVEQFYAFMHDHAEEAAAVLAEPGWLRLGPQHAMLVRRGERPRRSSRGEPHRIINGTTMTKIMGQAGMLGIPAADGGFGDQQAMRLLMLQARLGRRINELCMLDHDPLSMLDCPSGNQDRGAFVARLRYQQTKIDGAPDTILVDAEVVAIIQAQRDWAARHFTACGRPGRTPRYLFLGSMKNRNGDRPYNAGQFRSLLTELAARSGIRDGDGRTIDLQRTHTFRHTAATSLLNAGVPLHVVQRWLGQTPDPHDDDDLRPDAGRDRRSRVPALPQAHQRRPRDDAEPRRPLRHAAAGPAHRPDLAPRLLHAAAPAKLRPRERLPDLRQVRHRRQLPARTAPAAPADTAADRDPPAGLHRPHRHSDERRQHLVARPQARNRRAGSRTRPPHPARRHQRSRHQRH